jgi:hypothetical protein
MGLQVIQLLERTAKSEVTIVPDNNELGLAPEEPSSFGVTIRGA